MQFHLIFICLYYRIDISDDHYIVYNIYIYIYIIETVRLVVTQHDVSCN